MKLILWFLVILPSFFLWGCKEDGEQVSHTIKFEVNSDTSVARNIVVTLTKNVDPSGSEIILNNTYTNLGLPFTISSTIKGTKGVESFNFALSAEVKTTKYVYLTVYVDGVIRQQTAKLRTDFLGETFITF